MDQNQFLAVLGFGFVAAWIGAGFGSAVLCLLGAGLFWAAGLIAKGELDLAEVQERLRSQGAPDRSSPPPPPRARPRVR